MNNGLLKAYEPFLIVFLVGSVNLPLSSLILTSFFIFILFVEVITEVTDTFFVLVTETIAFVSAFFQL